MAESAPPGVENQPQASAAGSSELLGSINLTETTANTALGEIEQVLQGETSAPLPNTGAKATDTFGIKEILYQADAARDNTREVVTMWLIGLFCTIVVLTFVALFARGSQHEFDEKFFAELKQVLDVLIGPVVALLSSAIGFYFGYQQGSQPNSKQNQ